MRRSDALGDFEPVSTGVAYVEPQPPFDRLVVGNDGDARAPHLALGFFYVRDHVAYVTTARLVACFDALFERYMHLHRALLVPRAASRPEVLGLRNLFEPEDFAVKALRRRFSRLRHGDLHVIDRLYRERHQFAGFSKSSGSTS